MLTAVQQLVAPLSADSATLHHTERFQPASSATGESQEDENEGMYHDYLARLASLVVSLTHHVVAPPTPRPLPLALPPPATTRIANARRGHGHHTGNVNGNGKGTGTGTGTAALVSSALSHYVEERILVEVYVVHCQNHYSPLDVASGGFDVVALKEQIFNLRLPHQDLSFTVHGLDAADDVALSMAFAGSCPTQTQDLNGNRR